MNIVKALGVIFLAVYLILTGLAGIAGVSLSPIAANVLHLLAIASGVLMLISIRKYYEICEKK